MRPVAVKKWGVDPATRAAQITREQKMALVHLCKHWQVPISELGDLQHAVITAGGVDTKEVDPKPCRASCAPACILRAKCWMWMPAPAATTCKLHGPPHKLRCAR